LVAHFGKIADMMLVSTVTQISISGLISCSQLMNFWNLLKLGALRFHFQLASVEIDMNIYVGKITISVLLEKF